MPIVKVVNTGSEPFVDSHNGKQYAIPVGAEILVDSEVPSLWLGYPGLRDNPERADFKRRDQFARLQMRYGYHGPVTGQSDQDWEALRPHLEVYSLEGERVWMVLDDPAGERSGNSPIIETEAPVGGEDVSALKDRMERQEQELDALRKLIVARESTEEASEEIPEDTPRKVAVGARRGPSR